MPRPLGGDLAGLGHVTDITSSCVLSSEMIFHDCRFVQRARTARRSMLRSESALHTHEDSVCQRNTPLHMAAYCGQRGSSRSSLNQPSILKRSFILPEARAPLPPLRACSDAPAAPTTLTAEQQAVPWTMVQSFFATYARQYVLDHVFGTKTLHVV